MKPYLKHIINNLQISDTWKIQLTIAIIHLKSDKIEIMSHDKEDEVTEEPFGSLLSRYQIGL